MAFLALHRWHCRCTIQAEAGDFQTDAQTAAIDPRCFRSGASAVQDYHSWTTNRAMQLVHELITSTEYVVVYGRTTGAEFGALRTLLTDLLFFLLFLFFLRVFVTLVVLTQYYVEAICSGLACGPRLNPMTDEHWARHGLLYGLELIR